MKLNQKGMVDLILVAVLVVLLAAGAFTMWRIQEADKTVSNTENNTQIGNSIPIPGTEETEAIEQENNDSDEPRVLPKSVGCVDGPDDPAITGKTDGIIYSEEYGFSFEHPDYWTKYSNTLTCDPLNGIATIFRLQLGDNDKFPWLFINVNPAFGTENVDINYDVKVKDGKLTYTSKDVGVRPGLNDDDMTNLYGYFKYEDNSYLIGMRFDDKSEGSQEDYEAILDSFEFE
jgi:hypothetical protein